MRGLFISVEGIDGAGKSTHIDFISKFLEEKGLPTITTREPGGTPLGEEIRNLLLHNHSNMHSITELCLMFASRQELIAKVIEPNLDKGICVISDRYIDASIAYQGYGRQIGSDGLDKIISLLKPQLTPDITFLFDAPLEVAYERVSKNGRKDRIEQEDQEFFMRVQNAYYTIAKNDPTRVKVISTNQLITDTHIMLSEHLQLLLKEKCGV